MATRKQQVTERPAVRKAQRGRKPGAISQALDSAMAEHKARGWFLVNLPYGKDGVTPAILSSFAKRHGVTIDAANTGGTVEDDAVTVVSFK